MEAELRDKENMRREKDEIIRNLTDEKERQRETFERRINELESIIKCKYSNNLLCIFLPYDLKSHLVKALQYKI